MKSSPTKSLWTTACFLLAGCSGEIIPLPHGDRITPLSFGREIQLGNNEANPSTPFLRFAADGKLYAIWTEDESSQKNNPSILSAHQQSGKMAPSPLRNALLAASSDGGKTW